MTNRITMNVKILDNGYEVSTSTCTGYYDEVGNLRVVFGDKEGANLPPLITVNDLRKEKLLDTDDSQKVIDKVIDKVLKDIQNSKVFSVLHGDMYINDVIINDAIISGGMLSNNHTAKVNACEGGIKYAAGMGITVENGQRALEFRVFTPPTVDPIDKFQASLDAMDATIAANDTRSANIQARIECIRAAIIDNAQKVESEMKAFKESLAETIKGEVRANILEMMKPGGLLWRLAK